MTTRSDGGEPAWHAYLFAAALVGNGMLAFCGLGLILLSIALSAYGVWLIAVAGVVALVSAATGIASAVGRRGSGVHSLLRVACGFANLTMFGGVLGVLLASGMIGGIAVIAVPLLIGVPCVLNILGAGVGLGRGYAPHRCQRCGYDLRGTAGDVCTECGSPRAGGGRQPA